MKTSRDQPRAASASVEEYGGAGAGSLARLTAAASSGLARAFVNRNYALFMAGAFVSATGSWAQSVAVGWLVLDLGNSTFLLGLANFAQMMPLLLLGFPAGAVADRFDRRTLLLIAQTGMLATMAALALAAALGFVSIPLILVTAVVGGLFNALGWPTWSAFIKDLVGPERLRSAVALNSARFNLTRVIGPALAGVLLARYGAAVCLAVAAASALGVVLALLAIRLPPVDRFPPRDWLASLKEGLVYAWGAPRVRELLLVTGAVTFLAMPYQAFLPAFARDVLGSGPEGLGLLLTAVGLGALGGAVLSGTSLASRSPNRLMAAFAAATGLALVGLAASRQMELAVAALAVVGLASIGYLAVANATLQLMVPDKLVGRTMGLWTVVNAGVQPVGSLAIGAASEQVGLTAAVAIAGSCCALVGLGLTRRERAIHKMDRIGRG
jgi:MFS family permease